MFRIVALFLLLVAAGSNLVCADDRGAGSPRTSSNVFGQGVRETDKRSPADEMAGFHLPTGFVVELVASEPQIAKPLNMAFDAQGRLWITDTIEYPYPAAAGSQPRDSIKVLEDKNRDGQFETVTTFAEGLNIPIGILPVPDGVICFSIPNIMHLKDTDGDGRCDERNVLLGPFDTTRDTHGMINALRRGADGWIYACHGFNNQSHVKAPDGSEIHLISGNTFRFRSDGSHVEQFTTGQVNPFGMTCDDWGNWYTADCHSKPVTLLLRGGWYESFGRPHDGLGFVPPLMNHLHGSTAICGISYYMAHEYPAGFRNKFYSGNVMTSRINVNRLQVNPDSIALVEEPDLMTSDDPWFRPVDIQLGSDGALYVADFYNKIIGHYEVRLDHPDRDRTSGRIWRIAYRGSSENQTNSSQSPYGYAILSPAHLLELGHENASRRQLALDRLTDGPLSPAQREMIVEFMKPVAARSEHLRIAAVWASHRLGIDSPERLATALVENDSPRMVVAVLRAWEDQPRGAGQSAELRDIAAKHLSSPVPQVALAAAGALGRHGQQEEFQLLLTEMSRRPAEGAVTQHAMRIAARQLLAAPEAGIAKQVLERWSLNFEQVKNRTATVETDRQTLQLASILPAINNQLAAEALLSIALSRVPGVDVHRDAALRMACKHMTPRFANPVVALLKQIDSTLPPNDMELNSDQLDPQLSLATEALTTLRAAKQTIPDELSSLVNDRIQHLLRAITEHLSSSRVKPISWLESQGKMWKFQPRRRQDETQSTHKFLSSLTQGESYTGILSTEPFECPAELSFWIVGHDGAPNSVALKQNLARLVLVETGQVLLVAEPPRNDAARLTQWQLSQWQGQRVRFECVDQDAGNAFAWIGFGGFSLPALNPPQSDAGITKLAKLVEMKLMGNSTGSIKAIIQHDRLSDAARARLVAGYSASQGRPVAKLLAEIAELRGQTILIDQERSVALTSDDVGMHREGCKSLATALAAQMTLAQQSLFARGLVSSREGRHLLIELCDEGRIALQSMRGLKEYLGSNENAADVLKIAELSDQASATPSDAEQAIVSRIAKFKTAPTDREKGKQLYEKNCANCHKLRGAGQLVGPQLDGMGMRGLERLAEDVLLPNRNVDKAFRMTSLLMDDDRVLVGLVRDVPGGAMQLVGIDGKTIDIDSSKIQMRRDTTRSLMPDNFAELINDQDLSNLLLFILQ